MYRAITLSLVVTLGLVLAAPASATFYVDATFSSGSSMTDWGYADVGSVSAAGQVDPLAGLWRTDVPAGSTSSWRQNGLASTITDPVYYGRAVIKVNTFSGENEDQLLARMSTAASGGSNKYFYDIDYRNSEISVRTHNGSGWTPITWSYRTVSNGDGQEHVYGWEVDTVNRTLQVFFDNSQVGDPINIATSMTDSDEHFLGDVDGLNAHSAEWNQYTIASGAYVPYVVPEPSTLALLISALLGLLCYGWRKGK